MVRQATRAYPATDDFLYLLNEVFDDNQAITDVMSTLGITDRRALTKLTSNPEALKKARWKNGDPKGDELLDEDSFEEVQLSTSYLNWVQNNKGPVLRSPISIQLDTDRESFERFLVLDDTARGANADGVVMYDEAVARESERHILSMNPTPIPTPPVPASSAASTSGNSSATTFSDDAKKLYAFEKKLKPGDEKWTDFEKDSDWSNWKIMHFAKLGLSDMDEIVKPGYVIPSQANGDSAEAMTLYKKQNLKLFTLLKAHVKTNEGITFVKTHHSTFDGVSIWKDLENHYDDDMAAIQRAKFFHELITTSLMDSRTGLVNPIIVFRRWVLEYNYYAQTSDMMSKGQELTYFERYVRNVKEMAPIKIMLDAQEQAHLQTSTTPLQPGTRIDFYMRQAIRIDCENKASMLSTKRKINSSIFHEIDAGAAWDMSPQDLAMSDTNKTATQSISAFLATINDSEHSYIQMEDYCDEYEVNVGTRMRGRREGDLPVHIYRSLDPEKRRIWMSLNRKEREKIVTALVDDKTKSPPEQGNDHRLKNVGIAGRNARATNLAESETIQEFDGSASSAETDASRLVHATDVAIIKAMQNNTLYTHASAQDPSSSRRPLDRDPLDPTRLLSSQNKSSKKLIPIQTASSSNFIPANPSGRSASMAISRSAYYPSDDDPLSSFQIGNVLTAAQFPDVPIRKSYTNNQRRASMALSYPSHLSSNRQNSGESISSALNSGENAILLSLGLIDGGANTGLANPKYLRLLRYANPSRTIDVTGIGDANLVGLKIGTFAAKVHDQGGIPIVLIFNEYGELNNGDTVHSKLQLEDGHCIVSDRPTHMMGQQCISFPSRSPHVIPIIYNEGLPYITMTYPTDEDLELLPRIEMTNNSPWEPSRYDGDQQFGVRIPRDHNQAIQFDDEHGITRWQDAEKKEIDHLVQCIDFDEQGHRGTASAPERYNKTPSFVYTCKYDGRYKARMVARGHLTDPPVDNDYSGAVSLNSTPHSIAYPPGLNPFDEEDLQTNLANIHTSRINLCETYVQRLCDNFTNQTEPSLFDSGSNMGIISSTFVEQESDSEFNMSVVESRMEERLIRRIEHYNVHPIRRTESLHSDTITSFDATRDYFLRRGIRDGLYWEMRIDRIYRRSHGMILRSFRPITFCDDIGYVVCVFDCYNCRSICGLLLVNDEGDSNMRITVYGVHNYFVD